MTHDLLYLLGMVPAFGLAVLVVRGRPRADRLVRWAGVALTAGWVGLAGWVAAGPAPVDFSIFWHAGRDVLEGRDPYTTSVAENRPFFNPPTALPLYAGFAALPLDTAFGVWTWAGIGFGLALVPLSRWALRPWLPDGDGLSAADAWALTAAVGFSNAYRSNLLLGQMAVLTAVALVVVVGAAARGWRVVAAAGLAVATVKVGTAIPFGLLFVRRGRWPALALGLLFVAGLCLAATRPADLPGRVSALADNIAAHTTVGRINDYSDAGPHSADIIGLDKALYHLGLTDRGAIRAGQIVLLALLTGWLAADVVVFRTRPPAAHAALLALLGVIFLYHRNYNTVLLILPVVYCAGAARAGGPGRPYLVAAGAAALAVMFMPRKLLFNLTHSPALDPGYMWPVRAAVLPVSTWLVLAAMAGVWRGAGRPAGR